MDRWLYNKETSKLDKKVDRITNIHSKFVLSIASHIVRKLFNIFITPI